MSVINFKFSHILTKRSLFFMKTNIIAVFELYIFFFTSYSIEFSVIKSNSIKIKPLLYISENQIEFKIIQAYLIPIFSY